MVTFHSISQEEYENTCDKFKIIYAFHPTPFGKCLIAITDVEKAVVHLAFADNGEPEALETLRKRWPLSTLIEDASKETGKIVNVIFASDNKSAADSLVVLVKGTEFQTLVWQALMSIPRGTTTTYEEIAKMVNRPKAARAVGNAVKNNEVAYLIPCHRIMGKTGSDKYVWGIERKHDMINYEKKIKDTTN